MWGRRAAISWDDFGRLREELHELTLEVQEHAAEVSNLRYEWEDRQKTLFKASNRLEQAERRAATGGATPPTDDAVDDEFTARLKRIRGQDAVQSGA